MQHLVHFVKLNSGVVDLNLVYSMGSGGGGEGVVGDRQGLMLISPKYN